MKINYLKVEKTARVVTNDADPNKIKSVWLVAHGYGHLANYFINKFSELNSEDNLVIVPEGLHRYYLNGHSGKVGASWMTKEEREKDIEDYVNYLDKVYETFISPIQNKVIINTLGFSQGGATICRWASKTKHAIDNLIVWGSVIPPDMSWEDDISQLQNFNWIYVVGNGDELVKPEQQLAQLELLQKYHIKPQIISYKGGHDIDAEALRLLTQKCVKVRV